MDSHAGPVRTGSVSPSAARKTPYARPAADAGSPRKSLLSSLVRRGLGWITGGSGVAEDPEAAQDEEGAPLNSTPALARSRTSGSLADRSRAPYSDSSPRYVAPTAPASWSARSGSPRNESRRRTAHSRLDLSASYGSSLSGSQSLGALPNVNGAEVFGSPGPVDRYNPASTAYMRSHSPFASPGPSLGELRLRSPSPGSSRQPGQQLYPYASPGTRKRGLSPLNPYAATSERSFAGSPAAQQRVAWSPSRGLYTNGGLGSQAGSSVLGGSRREEVFGGRSLEDPPPPRVPQNEAERILDVLESLRTPHGAGRSPHSTRHINVPVAVPSANHGDLGYSTSGRSVFISPYARRQRQEQEERQELKRRTLSDALRQRDRKIAESVQRQTRTAAQSELSPPPEAQRRKIQKAPAPRGDEEEDRPAQRTRRKKTSARTELAADAMEEDESPPKPSQRINGARGTTPRLASPGRSKRARSTEMQSPSPPLRAPKALSPPPEVSSRASRASSTTSMRPGRTHTSRTHQKASAANIFTPDDDDDPPTDEAALRQAKMPKFSFPANFSFGVAPSAAAALPTLQPEAPASMAPTLTALPALDAQKMLKPKDPTPESSVSTSPSMFVFNRPAESIKPEKSPDLPTATSAPPLVTTSTGVMTAAPPAWGSPKPAELPVSGATNPFAAFQPISKASEAQAETALPTPPVNPFAAFQGFGELKSKKEEKAGKEGSSFAKAKIDSPVPTSAPLFSFAAAPSDPATEARKEDADTSMAAEDDPTAKEIPKPFSFGPSATSSAPTLVVSAPSSAPSPQPFSFAATSAPSTSSPAPAFSFVKPTQPEASTSAATPPSFSFAPIKSESPVVTTAAQASGPSLPTPPSGGFAFGKVPEPANAATPTPSPFSFSKPTENVSPFGKPADNSGTLGSSAVSSAPSFSFFKPAPEPVTTAVEPASTAMVQNLSGASAGSFDSAPASGATTPFGTGSGLSSFAPGAFNSASTHTASQPPANPFAAFQSGGGQTSSTGAFGVQAPAQPAFSFGSTTPQSTPAFNFGTPASSAPTTAFGSQPADGGTAFGGQTSSQPAFNAFGISSAPSSVPQFGFGAAPAVNGFGTQPTFGGVANPAPAASTFNFGGAPATSDASGSASSLFNIGSGGNESPNARRIKPLPASRRGSRR